MYLEVHIESVDPQLFIIDQEELMVGSHESNDIFVDVSSVSKKHVKIIKEDKRWYALDQGSTNGTYIDSERLVPGNRREIFVNQYLRLGNVAHIVLLKTPLNSNPVPKVIARPPKAPEALDSADKTRIVSLKDLSEAKPVPKYREEEEEKAAPKKTKKMLTQTESKSFRRTLIIALIIVIGGFILQKNFSPKPATSNLIEKTNEMTKKSTKKADEIEP